MAWVTARRATATTSSTAPAGAAPATLAEYDLDARDGLDFYDVSMVDGSNLSMYINVKSGHAKRVSDRGCIPASCTKPVNCPKALRAGGFFMPLARAESDAESGTHSSTGAPQPSAPLLTVAEE
jgi:hypothetical protein